jgi:hypothetical protein
MKLRIALALFAIAFAAAAGLFWWNPCVRPEVTVTNDSGAPIERVVISGVGFTELLGAIGPGASTSKSVSCSGESGLKLSFQAAGAPYSQEDLAYIESCGGYRVHLSIKPDRSVAVAQEFAY